jgi:hypothetical protein
VGCCSCVRSFGSYGWPTQPNPKEDQSHAYFRKERRSPPSLTSPVPTLWEQLPPQTRKRLLGLLSQLLERQLPVSAINLEEGSDDERGTNRH